MPFIHRNIILLVILLFTNIAAFSNDSLPANNAVHPSIVQAKTPFGVQAPLRDILVLIPIAITGGVAIILFFSRRRMKKKLAEKDLLINMQTEQLQLLDRQLKLKTLNTRVNPHFMFNSLNAIQYYINMDDKKVSLQYINRFSAFLRKLMNCGDELFITLKEEAELLNEYLWLEHSRFSGQFDYEITLPDDMRQVKILPLLTHGLVEAALYRGVLNLESHKKGKINIDFTTTKDTLLVNVTDNGVNWANAGELEKRRGVIVGGADMINRRIRLFNRQAKQKISLQFETGTIKNGQAGNSVKLQMPRPLFDEVIL